MDSHCILARTYVRIVVGLLSPTYITCVLVAIFSQLIFPSRWIHTVSVISMDTIYHVVYRARIQAFAYLFHPPLDQIQFNLIKLCSNCIFVFRSQAKLLDWIDTELLVNVIPNLIYFNVICIYLTKCTCRNVFYFRIVINKNWHSNKVSTYSHIILAASVAYFLETSTKKPNDWMCEHICFPALRVIPYMKRSIC